MNPQIITKLNELRQLIDDETSPASAYRGYNFSVSIDAGGVTYTHTAHDQQGNSLSVTERVAGAQ